MTEEKYTEEVFAESEELNETAFEEMADGDDPSVEDSDQMALDMETKNQQFEEDTEKVLELLQNGDYFDTRSLLLSYNEVDIAEIFEEILDALGQMPLPPYITHELKDRNRYQTVYAKYDGSAAAPTAKRP